jgi:hypothetical protein
MVVEADERLKKLYAEYKTLDDAQKTYVLGIAEALAFANASKNAAGAADSLPRREFSGTTDAVTAVNARHRKRESI